MVVFDRRSSQRKKTCVQAFVSDLGDALEVKCLVRDVTSRGCKIVSSRVPELPDLIQLFPEDFDKPIRGKIIWRHSNMAGMCFEHACSDEVRASIEALCNSAQEVEAEDVSHLGGKKEPLGFSERLKKHHPLG